VIICEAMGMPYDPVLHDAGFESDIDARNVMAFKDVTEEADVAGLCRGGERLFYSPWSARASAQ
jgi:hypothetical protein